MLDMAAMIEQILTPMGARKMAENDEYTALIKTLERLENKLKDGAAAIDKVQASYKATSDKNAEIAKELDRLTVAQNKLLVTVGILSVVLKRVADAIRVSVAVDEDEARRVCEELGFGEEATNALCFEMYHGEEE